MKGRALSAVLADYQEPCLALIHEVLNQAIRDARRRDPTLSAPALVWLNAPEIRELAYAVGLELPALITREHLLQHPCPARDKVRFSRENLEAIS